MTKIIMSVRRCLNKRRSLVKYTFLFLMSAILIVLWRSSPMLNLPASAGSLEVKNGVVEMRVRSNRSSSVLAPDHYMCITQGDFEMSTHADIYTYDLPDITDYTLIEGKRFKEYTIPVKSEKVAYGPDLDPVTVLLIPFSHVDPGYGRTMEEYYSALTKHTLNNMVDKLDQYKDFTFQWAETVFLERWWRDADASRKEKMRKLIKRGQLEIVLGGWVMPDEASTHYVSVIDQLIEGHKWVRDNLDTVPVNSWSNDPFGFSSTMPYLWKKSGMENMVILRIHQAIKGTLMKKNAMEFTWKQLWSDREESQILCHLMAYRGYWIGDTCGPYNQHICREYAFMHTEAIHKVIFVTKENLEERARVLYEQYRITAEIYRRHGLDEKKEKDVQLFLPMFLGEDFSFSKAKDFDLIYEHYKMLIDYINAKEEWKMKLKFGTLKEYFSLLRDYQDARTSKDGSRFPSLSGDFFPYSDYQNDYWTGYYTTRPFNKQMSRELQALLRTADIFHTYTLLYLKSKQLTYTKFAKITADLQEARRNLGMFLHHDGITGTSVLHVINDFKGHLFNSVTKTKAAIKDIVSHLLTNGEQPSVSGLADIWTRKNMQSFSEMAILNVQNKGKLVVLNPSSRTRREVVTIRTSNPITIEIPEGAKMLQAQLDKNPGDYLTSFAIEMLPFSVESFWLRKSDGTTDTVSKTGFENMDEHYITLENEFIRAEFDKATGMLVSLTELSGDKTKVTITMDIMAYTSARSGAYIFAPGGPATPFLTGYPTIKVYRGHLKSTIIVNYNGFLFIASLYNIKSIQGNGLHISTLFDIKAINNNNKEAIMRFKTDIENGNRFFTDQNSFQMMGRKTYSERRIEENYYPITSTAMIEDSTRRFTLHVAQPHGAASLESGWLEVMLDRGVTRDDDKGLGQGVVDNIPTTYKFILQVEKFTNTVVKEEQRYTFLSENGILLGDFLNNPVHSLFVSENEKVVLHDNFRPLKHSLPCLLEVTNLRSLTSEYDKYNSTSLVLHKKAAVCMKSDNIDKCSQYQGRVSIATLFPFIKDRSIHETSLTHLIDLSQLSSSDELSPRDMELRSFKIEF